MKTAHSERSRIGETIAKLRKEAGITQAELAESVGVRQTHISRIESGRHSTTLDILQAIARRLGRKIDFTNLVD